MTWFGPSGYCGCCGGDCHCTANMNPACNQYYDDGGSVLKTQKVASVAIAGVTNQTGNCDDCNWLNDTFLFTMCADPVKDGMQVICDRLFGGWRQTCAWIEGEYARATVGSDSVATLTITIYSGNDADSDGPDPRPTKVSCTTGSHSSVPLDSRTWVFKQTVPLINAKRYSGCDPSCTAEIAETFETLPEITALTLDSTTDSASFNAYACILSSSTCTVTLI